MKPPDDLVNYGRGRRFWRAVLADHECRPDELELLAEAARMLDLADALRETVSEDGLTVEGSRGQVTTHPALTELRQVRQELRHTLRELDLPDPPAVPEGRRLRAVGDA